MTATLSRVANAWCMTGPAGTAGHRRRGCRSRDTSWTSARDRSNGVETQPLTAPGNGVSKPVESATVANLRMLLGKFESGGVRILNGPGLAKSPSMQAQARVIRTRGMQRRSTGIISRPKQRRVARPTFIRPTLPGQHSEPPARPTSTTCFLLPAGRRRPPSTDDGSRHTTGTAVAEGAGRR